MDPEDAPGTAEDAPATAEDALVDESRPSGPRAAVDDLPAFTGYAVAAYGVPDPAMERIRRTPGLTLVDDPAQAAVVLISTRLSRSALSAALAAAHAAGGRVLALAHTGGETVAVDIMRSGGGGVIAEGNEEAVHAYAAGEPNDSGLVETYERRVGSARAGDQPGRGRDEDTGLPSASAFEERLDLLDQAGELPRVAFLRVLHLDTAAYRLAGEATRMLRLRLAGQYREVVRTSGVELYALGASDFALIGVGLSPNRAEQVAHQLARITESFAPSGHHTLGLAVGHAGPEVATEIPTLRELAARALSVAAEGHTSAVVGADSLSLGLASTTELEAALRVLEVVERSAHYRPGHGTRVATVAAEIGRHLGFEPTERAQMRLAAHLADLGLIGLPAEATGDPEAMNDDMLALWRTHPARGAAMVRGSAGAEVAEAIGAHHERWDGTGFPHGTSGDQIPIMARVIAVADLFDELVNHASPGQRLPAKQALQRLRAEAGVRLDPSLVEAALTVLGQPVTA